MTSLSQRRCSSRLAFPASGRSVSEGFRYDYDQMRAFVRLTASALVTVAVFYFIYWAIPSAILSNDDFGWRRNFSSFVPALAMGLYTWFQTASVSGGLANYVVLGAVLTGGIGFTAGFFGPMILAPEANQGPLLGFFTGPIGFLIGAVGGAAYWFARGKRTR